MSKIHKTEAIVIKKVDFSDSSVIAHFYTKDFGKVKGIIKGAKSAKSKIGSIVDIFNNVQIVFYERSQREIQLVSQASLINYFREINSDLEKLKYAAAVLELIDQLIIEEEPNPRLYNGALKILKLINTAAESPEILLVRFFLFFLEILGYPLNLSNCSLCGNSLNPDAKIFLNYNQGFACVECGTNATGFVSNYEELFNILYCLSIRKKEFSFQKEKIDKVLTLLEKFLKFHVNEFRGINSLKLY